MKMEEKAGMLEDRDDFRKDQALHFAPSPNLNKKSLARNEITF